MAIPAPRAPRHAAPLTEGPITLALVRLAVPIVAANILQTAYQLTDTFWVGRLSAQAVAAVSLSFPINFLMIAIGAGLPIAGTVLLAQYKGRGDHSAMDHVAAQTLLLVSCVAVVLATIGYATAEPVMRFLGAAPDVLSDAVAFLRMTFLGFVFVFGYLAFQALMRGIGVVYTPMYIVLGTVLLNFLLDPLFIFGYGPFPALGVAGAALATLCTQAVAGGVGLYLLSRGRWGVKLHRRDFKPDFGLMKAILRIGFPASVEQATRAIGMTLMTLLVATFGTVTVAAYGIGSRVLGMVIVPALGLSMATSTLVGQNIGAGRIDRAERTAWTSAAVAFSALLTVGVLLFLIARPLSEFLAPEGGEAIDQSAYFIRVTAFTFGFIGLQQVLTGSLRGSGDTVAPMVLAIISLWVLQFPLAYVLSKHTGLGRHGIWWSFAVSNVLAASVTFAWFLRGDWKKRRLLEEVELQRRIREEMRVEEAAMGTSAPATG
jgi:MATE family, multidrug efflux pump